MRTKPLWIKWLVLIVTLFAVGSAYATNGYFTHGTGTKNKAMAGSGIAMPEDAIDVTNNPAVAPFVGDQLVIGAALFSPTRKYETSASQANGGCFPGMGCAFTIGPNSLTSDSNYFVIPHIARSFQIDDKSAWAVSFYGRGGMNTDWTGGTATFDPDGPMGPAPIMTLPGTYGGGDAGVNLSPAFLDLTWATRVNEKLSLGVTGVFVAQMFKAEGVGNFAGYTRTFAASGGTTMPQNLSNNGTDWSYGYGLQLGLHAPLSDRFAVGIMYQTKIKMTELDDYADLFAERGGFDIPADLKVGLTVRTSDAIALNFDIEHIWYSDIDSVGNPIQNVFTCPTAGLGGMDFENCLGGNNGAGFGWDDMTVFKVGMAWTAGEDWTWRFGYSYGEQPIPNSQMTFNILAPAVMEQHLTAGFTLERTPGRQWNFAVMYAPNVELTGPQNFDPSQTVTFEMYQWEAEASYSWRF